MTVFLYHFAQTICRLCIFLLSLTRYVRIGTRCRFVTSFYCLISLHVCLFGVLEASGQSPLPGHDEAVVADGSVWADPLHPPMYPTLIEPAPLQLPSSSVIESSTAVSSSAELDGINDERQLKPKSRGPLRVGKRGDMAPLRYRVGWQPARQIRGQAHELDVLEHDLQFGAPVYMQSPHKLIFSGGVRYHQFNTTAVFPDSGLSFPDELWNIRIGKNYFYQFSNGWTGGLNVNLGSASDQPFGDLRNYNFGAIGFVSIPVEDRDAWNLALVYMPMSQIPFPIPSVAYQWNPSDQFSMNIGLPFEVSYRPTEQLSFEASYMLLTTVHTQTTYRWTDAWKSYVAFDWENQSWFLDQRVSDDERLFLYEMRLVMGIQKRFRSNFTIDVTTGYVFDRYFFNGQGFEDRNQDRIDIDSGPFVALEAALRF